MKHVFTCGETTITLYVTVEGDRLRVRLEDGSEHMIQARRLQDDRIEITEGDRVFRIPVVHGARNTVSLWCEGEAYTFSPEQAASSGKVGAKRNVSGVLTAPMVGVITAVLVSVGDRVTAYQPVAVVEAMKVLATIDAPFAGTVRAVNVQKGDQVEHGATLVEIDREEGTT